MTGFLDNFSPFQVEISFVMKGVISIYINYITSYLKAKFNYNFILIFFEPKNIFSVDEIDIILVLDNPVFGVFYITAL